jgi:iron complex transport system substrate-binding protein
MNQHGRFCLFLLFVVFFLTSCLQNRGRKTQTVVIEDMQGRKVEVPAEVERIVGVRPGALRLIAYMGATDKVVGIEQVETGGDDRPYMIAHPELLNLPFIGPRGGDNERIVHTQPDVIFITYASAAEADALMEKTGIPVVALEYPELGIAPHQLYKSLEIIGKVLHKENRADSLATYISQTIRELDNRTKHISERDKPSAYIGGVAHGRARNITSTHPDYPPFVFANVRNVASGMDKSHTSSLAGAYIDVEQLLLWDPDVIFIDESGLNLAREDVRPGGAISNSLTALKTKRIYTLLTYNSYAVNYETALIDSWYVCKILYPGLFSDVVPEEKANEILEMFLGKRIFHEIVTPDSFKPVL